MFRTSKPEVFEASEHFHWDSASSVFSLCFTALGRSSVMKLGSNVNPLFSVCFFLPRKTQKKETDLLGERLLFHDSFANAFAVLSAFWCGCALAMVARPTQHSVISCSQRTTCRRSVGNQHGCVTTGRLLVRNTLGNPVLRLRWRLSAKGNIYITIYTKSMT